MGIGGYKKPLYVLEINKKENAIYLGEENDLQKSIVYLRDVNWLGEKKDRLKMKCSAKIRSTQKEAPGILDINQKYCSFTFDERVTATSPGQACVFYLKDQVLGGGWITKTV